MTNTNKTSSETSGTPSANQDGLNSLSMQEARVNVISTRYSIVKSLIIIFFVLEGFYFLIWNYLHQSELWASKYYFIEQLLCLAIFLSYEMWYHKIQKYYANKLSDEPVQYKLLTLFVESSIPTLFFSLRAIHLPLIDAANNSILVFYIPFMLLGILYLRFWLCVFSSVVVGIEKIFILIYMLYYSSNQEHLSLQFWAIIMLILSGIIMGLIALLLRNAIDKALSISKAKSRVEDIFGKFVSKNVAEHIITKDLKLGGDTIHACVLFLDIRNFTHRSSAMTPEETVSFLNEVFNFTVAEVENAGGMVNKFLGDGFMAVFGTPLTLTNPCQSAVTCSTNIFEKLQQFNTQEKFDKVELGIGINYGALVSGVMGTIDRKEFTVIGDSVNIASRIESLNKELESNLLISATVYEKLEAETQQLFNPVENVMVKGKQESFTVYKLQEKH